MSHPRQAIFSPALNRTQSIFAGLRDRKQDCYSIQFYVESLITNEIGCNVSPFKMEINMYVVEIRVLHVAVRLFSKR